VSAVLFDLAVEGGLFHLDRGRAALLRTAGRWGRPLLRDRGLRVAAYGVLGVLGALGLALTVPAWLLLWGPLLLGVPHLLADLRYLVVQPGVHRHRGFLALLVPLLAAQLLRPSLTLGLATVALAALVAPGRRTGPRIAIVALAAAAAVAVGDHPRLAHVLFAHGHHLVALAFVLAFAARRAHLASALLPVALFAGASALLLVGAFDPWLAGTLRRTYADPAVGTFAAAVSPRDASPALEARLLLLFAFGQSVHYVSWLRLVPEDARPRPGLRGFVSSYRALAADLGRPVLFAAAGLTLALALFGLADAHRARDGYLRLAAFHAPLELAMLAWFAVRDRR
jgi:hypothetical protein